MFQLIKGRHDSPQPTITDATFRAANTDTFESLRMPDLRSALSVVAGTKGAVAERVTHEAVSSLGELVRGNFKGAAAAITRAVSGAAGMIFGAMVGTAFGGPTGSIVGMTLGGAVCQSLTQWICERAFGLPTVA